MSFFISDAAAQAAPAGTSPGIEGLLFPLAILAFFYFCLFVPRLKKPRNKNKCYQPCQKAPRW